MKIRKSVFAAIGSMVAICALWSVIHAAESLPVGAANIVGYPTVDKDGLVVVMADLQKRQLALEECCESQKKQIVALQARGQPLVEIGDTQMAKWNNVAPPPGSTEGKEGHVWRKTTITLSKPFVKRPVFVVMPRHEDIGGPVRWYSLVKPDAANPMQFDIIIATWAGTTLNKFEVTWVALGE